MMVKDLKSYFCFVVRYVFEIFNTCPNVFFNTTWEKNKKKQWGTFEKKPPKLSHPHRELLILVVDANVCISRRKLK